MGLVRDISVKITGQVSDDYNNNEYKLALAELEVICARYGLNLEESS